MAAPGFAMAAAGFAPAAVVIAAGAGFDAIGFPAMAFCNAGFGIIAAALGSDGCTDADIDEETDGRRLERLLAAADGGAVAPLPSGKSPSSSSSPMSS
jgi:hypothetical protein